MLKSGSKDSGYSNSSSALSGCITKSKCWGVASIGFTACIVQPCFKLKEENLGYE